MASKPKTSKDRHRYKYVGAVFIYNNLWAQNFTTETLAVSEAQARNNVCKQVLRKDGREKGKVTLAGHLMLSV